MQFPVFVNHKDQDLPQKGFYFVVAKNGVFLHSDTEILDAITLADLKAIPGLQDLQPKIDFKLPKIPKDITSKTLLFFRRVFQLHNAEAAVILYYSKETKQFSVKCPKQVVDHTSVHYEKKAMGDGVNLMVGTIHSHCDFNAFHSGVDVDDEALFTGLHLTFGNVNSLNFTISSSLVCNSLRNKVCPLSVAEGIVRNESYLDKFPDYKIDINKSYRLSMNDEEIEFFIKDWVEEIESDWLPKVSSSYRTRS